MIIHCAESLCLPYQHSWMLQIKHSASRASACQCSPGNATNNAIRFQSLRLPIQHSWMPQIRKSASRASACQCNTGGCHRQGILLPEPPLANSAPVNATDKAFRFQSLCFCAQCTHHSCLPQCHNCCRVTNRSSATAASLSHIKTNKCRSNTMSLSLDQVELRPPIQNETISASRLDTSKRQNPFYTLPCDGCYREIFEYFSKLNETV